jgi:hypothetical protein
VRPEPSEYAPYFERYISLVPGDRVVPILAEQALTFRARLGNLTEQQGGFRYAEGKWNVREVIGHLIDTERVFGFRALWFARGASAPLPSFEQDDFAATAGHDLVTIHDLVDELCAIRESHVMMFKHLPKEAWARVGSSGGNPLSTRAAAFIMAGHVHYHLELLRERYGV